MSFLLLKPLYRKLNQVIFQSNLKDCIHDLCILCECEDPWVAHKLNFKHRYELRRLVERLMNELLPLGIILRTEAENDNIQTNGLIYCVLCEENVGKKFDSDFFDHLDSLGHLLNVSNQNIRQETSFHRLDKYLEDAATLVDDDEDEAALINGVSEAGMTIDDHGSLKCATCGDFRIMDQEHFVIHVTNSPHLTEVNEQLIKMVMMLGFNRGILLNQNDAFYCTICKMKLSDNLDTSQVYTHIDHPDSSSGAAVHHANVSAHFQDYDTYDPKLMNDLSIGDCDRESTSSKESFITTADFYYPKDDSDDDADDYLGAYDGFGV